MTRLNHLPGLAWLAWLRNLPLRVGVLTGMYLSLVMVLAVLAANRLPFLERLADVRNGVAMTAFFFIAMIPVVSFRRHAGDLLISSLTGWLILSLAYRGMGFFFDHLFSRLNKTPFHLFTLGAIAYGLLAVLFWCASMVVSVRQHQLAVSRRRPY